MAVSELINLEFEKSNIARLFSNQYYTFVLNGNVLVSLLLCQ